MTTDGMATGWMATDGMATDGIAIAEQMGIWGLIDAAMDASKSL
jgi:hypothetical protein